MGLNNTPRRTYLSLFEGSVRLRVDENTPMAVSRVTKEGKTIWERIFTDIDAYITGIESKDSPYGKVWEITLFDNGTEYILSFPYSGGNAGSFLRTLPNIDFNLAVRIAPYHKIVDDKSRNSIYLSQQVDGGKWENVKWYFDKENPNGLPPLVQVKVKGQDTWDDSAILEFFENLLVTDIRPRIAQANKERQYMKPEVAEAIHAQVSKEQANSRQYLESPASTTSEPEHAPDQVDDLPF